MNWLFLITLIATVAEIKSYYIYKDVMNYFNSDLVKQATDLWKKHTISFQNTLSVTMQESYGFKDMNVLIKRPANPLLVSKGYYHTDNQVHIVLEDINLEEFPHISDPTISFLPGYNFIELEAVVSKMIIHTKYIVFRNTSNIVYDVQYQNAFTSPFLFEQVQNTGQLAITIEGCELSGIGILLLTGRTLSMGNTEFKLLKCHYNFEIYSSGVASPPVIKNYLLNTEGLSILHLLMKPLEAELVPKLQAALHTYVNTSSVFYEKLPEIRIHQEQLFEQTQNYINNVVRNLNVLTITRNMGKMTMEDFSIYWNDTFEEGAVNSFVTLHSMVLTGLETVYSSHTGGPYKPPISVIVSEALRYSTLQVRGSLDIQVGEKTELMHDFAAEINDVEVDISCNIDPVQSSSKTNYKLKPNYMYSIEVMGWRSLQFSSPGMMFPPGEALITGYLQTKVPIYLTEHLDNLLEDAFREADNEYKSPEDKNDNGTCRYVCDGDNRTGKVPEDSLNERSGNGPASDPDSGKDNTDYGQGNIDNGQEIVDTEASVDDGQTNLEPSDDTAQEIEKPVTDTDAQNQNPPDESDRLRRNNLRKRRQKQRRSRKNLNRPVVQKVTRTTKFSRKLNENYIHSDK